MKKILLLAALLSISSLAATGLDTSLVLKPTLAQLKAAKPVGNTLCPVSGEKVGGDMGKPVPVVYKGKVVNLCCGGCVKKFAADPAKYLAKAEAQAKAPAAK
jgi:YHS domain-containing protein